jgi:hypothetical protein
MTKESFILGLAALVVGGTILVPRVLAYRGNPAIQGPNYTVERHEAMEKAFETNDFNAWKALANTKGRVTQVINKGNFTQFARAHKLAQDGKLEEANKIRSELGLGLQNGSGNGAGMGNGQGRINR